jgi:hypothetical protein
MKFFSAFVFLLVTVIILGGVAFAISWDIPAPINNIERTIPDDKFPK